MMLIAGRYEIKQKIGVGGMGTVFLGMDTQTGVPVAIKQLKPEIILDDPEQLNRFIREGELLRQLNHPNIVKMLAAVEEQGAYYLVMEYVDGGSLQDVLHETPRLSVQRTLYIALDIADALTRAHRLNILHRDIKPANILISSDGTPRLTDFGMARSKDESNVTQEGMIVGTLAYLSPEALTGDPVDERSDIWAFGVTLFEMLAGERPFPQANSGQLVNAIMTAPIPDLELIRPDLPTALIDLIYRMLKRDRHERIPSVRLVGAEIEAIIRGATSSMQYVSVMDDTGRFESDQFTPTPTTTTPPHNLPAQPTPFVGREAELSTLQEMIKNPAIRLITLLGPGGVGKSRIALAVAEQFVTPLFPDGVFFVPLTQIDASERVIPTIAEHIKFHFSGTDDPQTQLLNYLQEKQMLIVLDTFEHLTGCADMIAQMLEAAPNIKLIVTSRERLRLRGETVYEVHGMTIPDDTDSPERWCEYPIVKLFFHSARRVMPDFELNTQTSPDVVRIVELVGGVPLGVELAAAWLEMLPLSEIAQEIEASLDFLETDLRDVPARHRSIRAVFDYSWNLLTDEEKDVFMKLAIFRGGFEREAAQKITGASLRTLTALNNKSLITRDPAGRYRLHKLSRQYAEEQFAKQADKDAVYAAHAQYYGELLLRVSPLFNTSKEKTALEEIEKELENITIARKWAQAHQAWDIIGRVMRPMLLFYLNRSLMKDGTEAFDDLAKAAQPDSVMYWLARMYQAWVLSRMGQYDLCREYSHGAYQYFMQHGLTQHLGDTLNVMSYVAMMQGRYTESAQYAKQSLDYVQTAPDNAVWYMGMGNWGYAEFLLGHYEQARQIYEQIIQKGDDTEISPVGKAYYLNNLGEILRAMNEYDRAMALFQQAHEMFRSARMMRGVAFTLNNIGGLQFMWGDHEASRASYEEAYRYHRRIGDQSGVGHSLAALGNVALFAGDFEKALDLYGQSLALRRQLGDMRGVGDSLVDSARAQTALGHYDRAQALYEEALAVYRQIGEKFGIGAAMAGLANVLVMQQAYDAALPVATESLQLSQELGNLFLQIQSHAALHEIAIARYDDKAVKHHAAALMQAAIDLNNTPAYTGALIAYANSVLDDPSQDEYIFSLLNQLDIDAPDLTIYVPSVKQRAEKTFATIEARLPMAVIQKARQVKLDPLTEFNRLVEAAQLHK